MGKYTIDEQIKIERESLDAAIFPRERMEHAEKLAKLEMEKRQHSCQIETNSVGSEIRKGPR